MNLQTVYVTVIFVNTAKSVIRIRPSHKSHTQPCPTPCPSVLRSKILDHLVERFDDEGVSRNRQIASLGRQRQQLAHDGPQLLRVGLPATDDGAVAQHLAAHVLALLLEIIQNTSRKALQR